MPASSSAAVEHQAPGRMRIRVQGTRGQVRGALEALESRVGDQPGVTAVTTDERTGSALLRFDPDQLTPQDIVLLAREAHAALRDLLPPALSAAVDARASRVAQGVSSGVGAADRAVLQATRGAVDLRMIVPLGLAGLSVRQLARHGPGLASIPWYVLAYYAFDSFVKLHAGARAGEPPARPLEET